MIRCLLLLVVLFAAACGHGHRKTVSAPRLAASLPPAPAPLACGAWAPALLRASNPWVGGAIVPAKPVAAIVCRYPLDATSEAEQPSPGAPPLRVSVRIGAAVAAELAARINAEADVHPLIEAEAAGTSACAGVGTNVAETVFFEGAGGAVTPVRFDFDQCSPASTPTARKPVGAGAYDDISALMFPDAAQNGPSLPSIAYTTRDGVRVTYGGEAPLFGRNGFAPRLGRVWLAFLRRGRGAATELHLRPINHGKDRLVAGFRDVTGMDWDDDYATTLAVTDSAGLHLLAIGAGTTVHATTVVAGGGIFDPAAAATGLPIAYTRTQGDATDVYMVDPTTGSQRRLTADGHSHGPLVWLWPRLVYTRDRALAVLDPTTGRSRDVAPAPDRGAWRAVDASRGLDRILATRVCPGACSSVSVIDLTLGTVRDVAPGVAAGFAGGSAHRIVVQTDCDQAGAHSPQISLLSPDSGRLRRIAELQGCDASVPPLGFG